MASYDPIELTLDTLPTAYDLSSRVFKTWKNARAFTPLMYVYMDENPYVCTVAHTAGYNTKPGSGAGWESYWARALRPNARYLIGAGTSSYAQYTTDNAAAPASRVATSSTASVGDVAGGATVTVAEASGMNRTVITLASTVFALADQAGVVAYSGKKIYDFPEAQIVIFGASASLTLTKSSAGVNADFDGDFSVGTATASNNASLSSTEANIIASTATPQAVAGATTAKAVGITSALYLDGSASAADMYLNFLVDDADQDVTGTPANLVVSGTVTVLWANCGDI